MSVARIVKAVEKTALEAKLAQMQRAILAASSKAAAAKLGREYELARYASLGYYRSRSPVACDCPHVGWMYEALRALYKGFPELAFEAIGLLHPALGLDPPSAATTPESAPSAPATTGELMTADLRAMGYGPAEVKAMLKSGALERVSFGWYRLVHSRR